MANRAALIRQQNSSLAVVRKGRNSITFDLGSGRRRLAITALPLHYGPNLADIDTTWLATTGAWQYKVEGTNVFNLYARDVLNAGDTIQWLDPATGGSLTFQPLALNWVSATNEARQQIRQPQSVTAQVVGDSLYWLNGYGPQCHFRYTSHPLKLIKHLIIDSYNVLPVPTVSDPYLELEFILKFSGVTLYVDGVPWDRTTRVATSNRIECKTSDGRLVWVFEAPTAYDSARHKCPAVFQLRRQGANRYCTVRIPKGWLDLATFPIVIDPTISVDVAYTSDDCMSDSLGFNDTYGGALYIDDGDNTGGWYGVGLRWRAVDMTGAVGVTSATLTLQRSNNNNGTNGTVRLKCQADNHPTYFSSSDRFLTGRACRDAYVDHVFPNNDNTQQIDVTTLIRDLIETADYSYTGEADDAIVIILGAKQLFGLTDAVSWRSISYSYDHGASTAAQLDVEYTTTLSVVPSSITSAESFGTAAVSGGGVLELSPSGIASSEAFGSLILAPGVVAVTPNAITSSEAFGLTVLTPGVVVVAPSSIGSTETFGTPTLVVGSVGISPSAITSNEAFGNVVIVAGAVVLSPTGIVSSEAFGTSLVTSGPVSLSPTSISSGETFGNAAIATGAVTLLPSSIASSEAFGTNLITSGAIVLSPTGIASNEAFGDSIVGLGATIVAPSGIASNEAFGTNVLSFILYPSSTASEELLPSSLSESLADWSVAPGDGAVTLDSDNVHSGTYAIKLSMPNLSSPPLRIAPMIVYTATVEIGETYALTFWTRGDGTTALTYLIDWTDDTALGDGATATEYQQTRVLFTPTSSDSVTIYILGGGNDSVGWLDDISLTKILVPNPAISYLMAPEGIITDEVFGEAGIAPGSVSVLPSGISTGELFGSTFVGSGELQTLLLSAISSLESLGTPTFIYDRVVTTKTGLLSTTVSKAGIISSTIAKSGTIAQIVSKSGRIK